MDEQTEDHELLYVEEPVQTPVISHVPSFHDEVQDDALADQDDLAGAGDGVPAEEESGQANAPASAQARQRHKRRGAPSKDHRSPHSVTARSASSKADHFWLVHHQAGMSAHIKAFESVEALAAKAHVLVNNEPTREQIAALQRGEAVPQSCSPPPPTEPLGALRPLAVRRAGMRRHHSHGSSSSSSSSSDDSSSDLESSDSEKDNVITQAFWVDVQTADPQKVRKLLQLFPVHHFTVERVLDAKSDENDLELDSVEVFTSLNYVFSSIACKPLESNVIFNSMIVGTHREEATTAVALSIIAFEDWIVTIHAAPIVGMMELLKRIQAHFNNKRRLSTLANTLDATNLVLAGGLQTMLMTPAWVMSTLVDFVVESFLPDPTKVLAEVDSVDEMVLLIAPDSHNDQADLLRRIAILRRHISSQRGNLFRKEQLVQQLLMPSMRSTFLSSSSSVVERYKHTLSQINHVAERLDAARDILNQANSNFVSGVSMSMSQASTRMNLKMQLLSQVATICLPLNLVAGIFGMNVNVPYAQADGYTSLTPFFVIVGCMALWLVLLSPPLVKTFIKMRREKSLMRKAMPQS